MKSLRPLPARGAVPAAVLILALAGCATGGPAGGHAGIDPAARAPATASSLETGAQELGFATTPPPGVRVFTGEGEPVSWEALVEAARGSRVVLLGEIHDDVPGHQARHALLRALAGGAAAEEAGGACIPHVVSLEMLESDVQLVVDEYQAGLITPDHFRRAARPWDNHARDYEPYLDIARRCDFPVVAANPPRRYVNRVARLGEAGLEALAPEALTTLPPLPVARPTERYRAQWNALMGGGGGHGAPAHGADGGPAEDPVLMAQNLWDAGMAWAVAQAARAHSDARVIHVAGAFHVQDHTGIPEHLARYMEGTSPLVVVAYPTAPGTSFAEAGVAGRGDFVLLTERGEVP